MNSSKENLKYYAAFSYMLNTSPLFKARLFEYFDYDIKGAFLISPDNLKKFKELNEDIPIPREFLRLKTELDPDTCLKEALLDKDIKILTYEDFPPLLKEIPDFPLSLYYKGNIEEINFDYTLAVVGSRLASNNAKIALSNILDELNSTPITIVSGLAMGIDTTGHEGAIRNNLKTIGVIGSGLDVIYPKQNKDLYKKIIEKSGVIFSEFPLKTQPIAKNFPQRNRIVVGLSSGTLVAEAKLKSGAMISANLTLDYNRELLAMPGNITNPNTEGIYHLIKNGAAVVTKGKDILEQLNWDFDSKKENSKEIEIDKLNAEQKIIYNILELENKNFDEIIESIEETNKGYGLDITKVLCILTELEIKGLIKQINNSYYKC